MTLALTAFQQAVFTTLSADSSLMTLLDGQLCDRIPEGTLTETATLLFFEESRTELRAYSGSSVQQLNLQLGCISRRSSRERVLEVCSRVHSLLHHAALDLGSGLQLLRLDVRTHDITPSRPTRGFRASITLRAEVYG